MNFNRRKLVLAALLALGSSGFAQVSTNFPSKSSGVTQDFFKWDAPAGARFRLEVPHNRPELIRQELSDPSTVRLIGRFAGLTESEISSIEVVLSPGLGGATLGHLPEHARAAKLLGEQLGQYVEARREGHTQAFLLAALTNQLPPSAMSDPDFQMLLLQRVMLPFSLMKKTGSGTNSDDPDAPKESSTTFDVRTVNGVNGNLVTNGTARILKADGFIHWSAYTVADGDIGWRYHFQFNADGSVDPIIGIKCDAKELDPKYRGIIEQVEAAVKTEMKNAGIDAQPDSRGKHWRLTKESLKGFGIDWRSPDELNPHLSY